MRSSRGFTLVELMITVAVFGIILTGLATLITSTLRFSSVSISASDRLREVEAAAGYVADNVRRASDVDVGSCVLGSVTADCLAIVVPSASVVGGAIDTYELILYRYVERDSTILSFLPDDAYADANTVVLTESRGTATSTTPADVAIDTSGWPGPFLVLDQVVPSAASFATNSAGAVEISLRISDSVNGAVRETPSAGAYTVLASPRNAP